MTRSRMKLSLIENRAKRKACYKKRMRGLIKKVEELTTLCGVEACIIIYSPFDSEPQIWPPNHTALMEILHKFKSLSLLEQNRRMVTQESFTRHRIKKLLDLCKKLRTSNRQNEIGLFVSESMSGNAIEKFNVLELKGMRRPIHLFIENISRKIDAIKEKQSPFPTLSLMLPNLKTALVTGYNQPGVAGEVTDMGYHQNPTTMGIRNTMIHPPGVAEEVTDLGYHQNPTTRGIRNTMINPPGVAEEVTDLRYHQNPTTRGIRNTMIHPPGVAEEVTDLGYHQNPATRGIRNMMIHPPGVAEEVTDTGYHQNLTTRGIRNMMIHPPGNTANSYYPSAVVAPETNNFHNPMPVQNELRFRPGYGYSPMMAQQNQTRSMNMNTVAQNQQSSTGLLFPNAYFMNDRGRNSSSSGMNPVVQPVPSRRHEQSPAGSNTTDWISFLLRDFQGSTGNTGFF